MFIGFDAQEVAIASSSTFNFSNIVKSSWDFVSSWCPLMWVITKLAERQERMAR